MTKANRLTLLSLTLAGLVLAAGCKTASTAQASVEPPVTVMAIDTSASAKAIHQNLYNRMVSEMENTDKRSKMILFRFDSSPAEFYSGPALIDGAEAGKTIRAELDRESDTSGTNLARLFEKMDVVLTANPGPLDLHIFTDCGVEEMTREDDESVQAVLRKWHDARDVDITFHGVVSGHRERLRQLVPEAAIR